MLRLLPSALHAPEGDPAHPTSAVQHFHDKLLHIRERLKTGPGKRMAEKRHQLVSHRPLCCVPIMVTQRVCYHRCSTFCRLWTRKPLFEYHDEVVQTDLANQSLNRVRECNS